MKRQSMPNLFEKEVPNVLSEVMGAKTSKKPVAAEKVEAKKVITEKSAPVEEVKSPTTKVKPEVRRDCFVITTELSDRLDELKHQLRVIKKTKKINRSVITQAALELVLDEISKGGEESPVLERICSLIDV